MLKRISIDRQMIPYVLFYGVIYMSMGTFSPYISLYYNGLGYTIGQIGLLTAIGPLISIAAQPLWGMLSDRTNKKRVLALVLTGAFCAMPLYALKSTFFYIAAMALLYNAFFSAVSPLGDALTLQFTERRRVKFSSIRLVGTISYAVMAALVGVLLTDNIRRVFALNAVLLGMGLVTALLMPNTKNRSCAGDGRDAPEDIPAESQTVPNTRGGMLSLLRNKLLLCVYLTAFVTGVAMTFYSSFLGIRLTELGADTGQVGIASFISAASEIPVLLLIDRVFGRMKPVTLLILSGFALGLRIFILYKSTAVSMVYAAQLLQGLTYMVPYYFSVLLINKHASDHLKSTAQSLYAVCRSGLAALTGTVGGGFLAQTVGIQNVYLLLAVFVTTACCVLPGVLIAVQQIRKRRA